MKRKGSQYWENLMATRGHLNGIFSGHRVSFCGYGSCLMSDRITQVLDAFNMLIFEPKSSVVSTTLLHECSVYTPVFRHSLLFDLQTALCTVVTLLQRPNLSTDKLTDIQTPGEVVKTGSVVAAATAGVSATTFWHDDTHLF